MALGRVGRCCRSFLLDPSKRVFCGVLQPGWMEGCIGAKRHLLSENVIRLHEFQQRKLAVAHLRLRGKKLISNKLQNTQLILRDDLKLFLHLCDSADDMLIVRDAMYRYHQENLNFAFKEFKFGPLFVRQCYELGLEEFAAATVTDEKMRGFFNDSTSFNITIDMLFTKGLYEKALEVLGIMKSQGVTLNTDTVTLAAGTCYKLNTPRSYEFCSTLIEDKQSKGFLISKQAQCFFVALAIRQNDIEKAKLLYPQIRSFDNKLSENLTVLILAMTGAVEDAVSILSAAVLPDRPTFVKKPKFSEHVLDVLRSCSNGGPHMMEVEQVVANLKQAGQVTSQTLDDMLCHTPKVNSKPVLVQARKASRRTMKPLNNILLSE
ncbi:pentatricopeptide repeat-containing protein 2, mitochondrial [Dicentrarchus labrax]|uniref:Pentatricopeptide repeat-containing protein 2, mitochondrial n=1 Tax=Dicentrarchus labrax TaxID=13489 RepID=A0A8P4KCT6_DICLA|nr:pentatricopeptide repeat-containing protein 2, mitochondrial [Dicentrarchus labrax]